MYENFRLRNGTKIRRVQNNESSGAVRKYLYLQLPQARSNRQIKRFA